MEISRPQTIRISAEEALLTEKALSFRYREYAVFVKRGKSYRISIWRYNNGDIELVARIELDNPLNLLSYGDIEDDLKEAIVGYINNWDYLLEKQVAEIILKSDIKYVPQKISEKEALAEILAETILKEYMVKTFYIKQSRRNVLLDVYCFNQIKGVYEPCEEEIRRRIEDLAKEHQLLKAKITRWIVEEAFRKIRDRTIDYWRPSKHKLVFYNMVFDWDIFIETGDFELSLSGPDPSLIITHYIPWKINLDKWNNARKGLEKYIPPKDIDDILEIFKSLAPQSYKAFLDWVKREDEPEEEAKPKVVLLLEIIGYTLYPHEYPFHKAILLVGEGRNGKTTYINLIETILGRENVSHVNLKDLDPRNNRFAAYDLHGKLANISSEPVSGTIDVTLFKQLTGEDTIRFERKFRDAFNDKNYAKMIFAANKLPRLTEDTYAFWRRWIVIEFPNQFPLDPKFFEKTFTPEEIEGIILSSLHAFRLVLLRKGFTSQGTRDPKEEWLKRSNNVYLVMNYLMDKDFIELDKQGWIETKDLYSLYIKAAEILEELGEDIEKASKRKFTEEIASLFGIRRGQKKYMGKKYNVYFGVKIKDREKAENLLGELITPDYESQKVII